MTAYTATLGDTRYRFDTLSSLMACATPRRSGDALAGIAAETEAERVAARYALADVPLSAFLDTPLVPYEDDDVTRLICDGDDPKARAAIPATTVGDLRDWLLARDTSPEAMLAAGRALPPEAVAAVSKLMRNQDLVRVAARLTVVSRFRTTLGLPGRLATRLQPNHPADDLQGIAAVVLDGLLQGAGDAVIGINPASDDITTCTRITEALEALRLRFDIPVQSCVLTHVTNSLAMIEANAPVDLVFQSIAGTQKANDGFGVTLPMLTEALDATRSLGRGTVGQQAMYFETGQGAALSADAHHGVDQQTLEVRAYGVARAFDPLLVNTVVGFIGPEYLFDGKQVIRAGLEDHFCGKLLGLPMGVDVCYTNHMEADQDDMDTLVVLLERAGVNFVITVPGSDDVMLSYQSLSFDDIGFVRDLGGKRPAPEFEDWLARHGLDRSGADPRALHNLAIGMGLAS